MTADALEAAVNQAHRALLEVARLAHDDTLRETAERSADAVVSAWLDAE